MLRPSTVLLEFLTWFAWLACFASLQNMLCVRYPDLRGVCRKAYVFTMMVPILGSVWLMARSDNGTDMFALLNHGFGAGVFAQTFLRAVVLLVEGEKAAEESAGSVGFCCDCYRDLAELLFHDAVLRASKPT